MGSKILNHFWVFVPFQWGVNSVGVNDPFVGGSKIYGVFPHSMGERSFRANTERGVANWCMHWAQPAKKIMGLAKPLYACLLAIDCMDETKILRRSPNAKAKIRRRRPSLGPFERAGISAPLAYQVQSVKGKKKMRLMMFFLWKSHCW